jgi:hypothetical protein
LLGSFVSYANSSCRKWQQNDYFATIDCEFVITDLFIPGSRVAL